MAVVPVAAPPDVYIMLMEAANVATPAQIALASRGRGVRDLAGAAFARGEWWRTVLVGLGFFLSYGLVLAALRTAPAGLVAAVRETSLVIAVVMLAVTGQEPLRLRTLLGAGVVAVGVALVVA